MFSENCPYCFHGGGVLVRALYSFPSFIFIVSDQSEPTCTCVTMTASYGPGSSENQFLRVQFILVIERTMGLTKVDGNMG